MEQFLFVDGTDICLYKDGAVQKFPSKFIENYKKTAAELERSKEWKHTGEGAQFRGDVKNAQDMFDCSVTGAYFYGGGAVYTFTADRTSGVYGFTFGDEKAPEVHILTSLEYSFFGGCLNQSSGKLVTTLSRNYCNADLALLDIKTGAYCTLTESDTQDLDPFFDPTDGDAVYFSSRGAGRTSGGEFVSFSPASVLKLNLSTMELEEVLSSPKYSYFKPIVHGGVLYAIKAPAKEKKPNPVIEILLIPYRILQGIAGFLNAFVRMFAGKSLTSGGNNPAKGRDYDSRKEFVRGNLIDAEKELKKNKGKRDKDYGFAPLSWQLVNTSDGTVLKSGVADYDIAENGDIIATNGRHVFYFSGGKWQKLCDTDRCVNLSFRHGGAAQKDIFGL